MITELVSLWGTPAIELALILFLLAFAVAFGLGVGRWLAGKLK